MDNPNNNQNDAINEITNTVKNKINKTNLLIIALIISLFCNFALYGSYNNIKKTNASTIEELQGKYESLNSELTDLQTKYNNISKTIAEKDSKITSLQGQITTKDTEIKNLNDQITKLKAETTKPTTTAVQTNAQPQSTASVSNNNDTSVSGTVYVTKTGSKYHESWCSSLSKSKIPISLSDAKAAGYTACKRCH